jgi:hypothetical protein
VYADVQLDQWNTNVEDAHVSVLVIRINKELVSSLIIIIIIIDKTTIDDHFIERHEC